MVFLHRLPACLFFFAFFALRMGFAMALTQSKKGKTAKMKKPNSSIEEKIQTVNPVYKDIFNFLKTGGYKITKALRKTRGAKLSDEIKKIREELSKVLNSTNPVVAEIKHIRILANAIQNTKVQLNDTKILFHSKGLRQTREYTSSLLMEAKIKYRKTNGGVPMGK